MNDQDLLSRLENLQVLAGLESQCTIMFIDTSVKKSPSHFECTRPIDRYTPIIKITVGFRSCAVKGVDVLEGNEEYGRLKARSEAYGLALRVAGYALQTLGKPSLIVKINDLPIPDAEAIQKVYLREMENIVRE